MISSGKQSFMLHTTTMAVTRLVQSYSGSIPVLGVQVTNILLASTNCRFLLEVVSGVYRYLDSDRLTVTIAD